MSENVEKCEENLENNLNNLKINDKSVNQLNDLNKNALNEESAEECSDQYIDCPPIEDNCSVLLSEEELNRRKVESIELKSEGNQCFREELYEKSIEFYTKAIDLCPEQFTTERSVLYSNRSAAHRHCQRLAEALEDSNRAIELNPTYVKALLRRAQICHEMSDKLDDSLKDYERVLELEPNCTEAIVESNRLKVEINERNEKLKTEMMSKLKDLGNLVLRPFGLSTDNFKMTQNAETGGYSVNFQNN